MALIAFEEVPTIIVLSISYAALYFCFTSSFLPKACYNFWDCSSLGMFYFFYYIFIFIHFFVFESEPNEFVFLNAQVFCLSEPLIGILYFCYRIFPFEPDVKIVS